MIPNILFDKFNRIHDYLRISLTESCNFNCNYCMPIAKFIRSNSSKFMSAQEIASLARIFVDLGVTKIRLTGGEPLLRKDFSTIAAHLGKLPVELALTTNGVYLDRYLPDLLQNNIKAINVSLDTLDDELFHQITGERMFSKVFSNILLLLKNDFKVKINFVVMNGINDHEVRNFVELTKNHLLHVRFIEFMPFKGNQWKDNRYINYRILLKQIQTQFEITKLEDDPHDTAKRYKVNESLGTFAFINTMSEPFCGNCNRIRLTADGKIKNCLFSNDELDLLTTHRNGGSVKDLIHKSIQEKYEKHGGQELNEHTLNRSMIKIGG